MSVWRNFLATILPWVFKKAEAGAVAAAKNEDVKAAVALTEADVAEIANAAAPVVAETVKKATKPKK